MSEESELELIKYLADQGIGKLSVEAKLGRKMTPDELMSYRSVAADRQLRIAMKKARGPKSVAERVREHVAKANDVGDSPLIPRHPRLKERCRYDLEAFGWYYCRRILRHRASKIIRDGLIRKIQDAILHGGQFVVEYGRGAGKTTWCVHIAIVWAILYGHRRYPVIVSATGKLAKKNLKAIKKLLSRGDEILADFPEIAYPIRRLGDVSQRSSSQTFHGQATDIEWASDQIVLPTLRDSTGAVLGPGCGAIVGSVGVKGAVRGANESGQRPDFIVFDDPQTRKIARSPKSVEEVISYIHEDALGLAGQDSTMSAFVTITPQVFGDVATELASESRHAEWSVSIEPFVRKVCPNWDTLVADFVAAYVEDAANHDFARTRSRAWYVENRKAFESVEVLDPLQFDQKREEDAVHHILNLRARLGERSFNAEIMMEVADVSSELTITADLVATRLNGAPRCTLPPGTSEAVAFVDVNVAKGTGLSWGVLACGVGRVTSIVAYGRYPERGSLLPPGGASETEKMKIVANAVHKVARTLTSLPLRNAANERVELTAVGFDIGYQPKAVTRALAVIRKRGFRVGEAVIPCSVPLIGVKGFGWKNYKTQQKNILRRGDHIYATRLKGSKEQYLAEMAPYWREIMQSSFLETPLMPGSCSLYGFSGVEHFEVANEITAEKLVKKYTVEKGGQIETGWDWVATRSNHYCDVFTGCFVLASWYKLYDALPAVVDAAAHYGEVSVGGHLYRKVVPIEHQDDLFDPNKNAALAKNLYGDKAPIIPAKKVINRKPVYKFKRGRWRK